MSAKVDINDESCKLLKNFLIDSEKVHSIIQITNINQINNHFFGKKCGLLGIIAYFCAQITII